MPRLHALELVPDEAGQAVVRRDWQRLHDAGLPSQLDHRGSTNVPHVTVVEAPDLPTEALDVAAARLGTMLPLRAQTTGLVVLGEERVTLARAIQLDDDVVRRVLAVRVQVPERAHRGWLAHVTLARRLERSQLARSFEVLGGGREELLLTELRRWDPDRGTVTVVSMARPR